VEADEYQKDGKEKAHRNGVEITKGIGDAITTCSHGRVAKGI
jgi:hypothetical protein